MTNQQAQRKSLEIIAQHNPQYQLMFLSLSGSSLHGTKTKNSDTDFKGVFMPTLDDIILGTYPKTIKFETSSSKNSKDDIDLELIDIITFIKNAHLNIIESLDIINSILYSNGSSIIYISEIFKELALSFEYKKEFPFIGKLLSFINYSSIKSFIPSPISQEISELLNFA